MVDLEYGWSLWKRKEKRKKSMGKKLKLGAWGNIYIQFLILSSCRSSRVLGGYNINYGTWRIPCKGFIVHNNAHETDFNNNTYLRKTTDSEFAVKSNAVRQAAREGDLGPLSFTPKVHERIEGLYKMWCIANLFNKISSRFLTLFSSWPTMKVPLNSNTVCEVFRNVQVAPVYAIFYLIPPAHINTLWLYKNK